MHSDVVWEKALAQLPSCVNSQDVPSPSKETESKQPAELL